MDHEPQVQQNQPTLQLLKQLQHSGQQRDCELGKPQMSTGDSKPGTANPEETPPDSPKQVITDWASI